MLKSKQTLRRKLLKPALALTALATSIFGVVPGDVSTAAAQSTYCTAQGLSLRMVGVDNADGTVYTDFREENSCGCRYTRFSADKDTDGILRVLMAAKLSGNKVRIDLERSGDCNSGYRVYLQ